MQHGNWAVAAQLWLAVIFAAAQHTMHAYDAYAEPSRAESFDSARLVLNGDNMLGLCDPSNLLFKYSFYPPRSDALFSNYFEDLFHSCDVCQRPPLVYFDTGHKASQYSALQLRK